MFVPSTAVQFVELLSVFGQTLVFQVPEFASGLTMQGACQF